MDSRNLDDRAKIVLEKDVFHRIQLHASRECHDEKAMLRGIAYDCAEDPQR
jgi:hypothetical protein